MTTHDENHITRTSPQRFMKGLIIIVIPLIFLGSITIVYWEKLLAFLHLSLLHHLLHHLPPLTLQEPHLKQQVAVLPLQPRQMLLHPASSGPSISIPAGAATPGNPAYAPDTLTVKRGDVITVTNDDTAPHTATSGTGPEDPNSAQLFDTSIIMAGDTAQIDTDSLEPADYAYHCTVHPFMKGTITVQ